MCIYSPDHSNIMHLSICFLFVESAQETADIMLLYRYMYYGNHFTCDINSGAFTFTSMILEV